MQQLDGAVFLAVTQSVFTSELVHQLDGVVGSDPKAVVNVGATDLRNIVPENELGVVVDAYNVAVSRVFVLTAALSACMMMVALVMEWKSIKGMKGPVASEESVGTEKEESEMSRKG